MKYTKRSKETDRRGNTQDDKVDLSSIGKQYLHQFKGETLMEDAVNPSSSWQLIGINLVSRAFNAFLKVHGKLLDHPERKQKAWSGSHGWAVISREGHTAEATYWSRALVLRAGSSGRKFLYSSTSFSMERSWLCSLFRSPGRVSRMWLVNCCTRRRFKIINL